MGGSSIFFTSMATGMILSVSWGTRENAQENEDPGQEADAGSIPGKADAAEDPAGGRKEVSVSENSRERVEFEVHG